MYGWPLQLAWGGGGWGGGGVSVLYKVYIRVHTCTYVPSLATATILPLALNRELRPLSPVYRQLFDLPPPPRPHLMHVFCLILMYIT